MADVNGMVRLPSTFTLTSLAVRAGSTCTLKSSSVPSFGGLSLMMFAEF